MLGIPKRERAFEEEGDYENQKSKDVLEKRRRAHSFPLVLILFASLRRHLIANARYDVRGGLRGEDRQNERIGR